MSNERHEREERPSRPEIEARRVVSFCTRCGEAVVWYVAGRVGLGNREAERLAQRATVRERRWCGGCRAREWALRSVVRPGRGHPGAHLH